MDEENRYPREPQDHQAHHHQAQERQSPDDQGRAAQDEGAEHTRPFTPVSAPGSPFGQGTYGQGSYGQGAYPTTAAPAARGGRGLSAAVLVGALVLGGAAGVGGSAAYQAFSDHTASTTPSDTSGSFQATKTAQIQDGTVEKVANDALPAVVKVNVSGQAGSGSGSGIVLSKKGLILTNNHVVAAGVGDGASISVSFNDGSTKKATVVGTDPVTDVAVIKVPASGDLVPASLGKSGALKVGQTVVAVGSPYGLNATVTSGIVSALNRPVSVSADQGQSQSPGGSSGPGQNLSTTYPAIQTDAAINPGNSGGPLVDMSGRVVGINSSIRTGSGSSTESGGSIGLGFAIPIDEVLPIINQITDGNPPTHARLGVSVSDVAGDTLNTGAQLRTIENGGSAADAGLKTGDVITKVGDQVIDGSESLVATIRGHRPGEKVVVTYLRGGRTSTTTAALGSDENNTAS